MPAVIAPSPRLLADPADPFVAANGLIPRLTRSMALKSTSIDVVTTAKQATKEVDFRFWGRLVSDDKTRRLAVPHPTRMPSRRIVQWLPQTQLGELAIIGTSFTL